MVRATVRTASWSLILLALFAVSTSLQAETISFENLSLPSESAWNGSDRSGTVVGAGPYGGNLHVGSFTSGSATFTNHFETAFGTWSGFAYSNQTDHTTPGFMNQLSSYAGSGRNGSSNYGVAFGYDDLTPNVIDAEPFDPGNLAHLSALPHFTVADGKTILGAYVTNTTYAARSMEGDDFGKRFGGADGSDPDWLKISAYGTDALGQILSVVAEFYLADFRAADSNGDYILDTWEFFDLSALVGATTIYFNVSSSDVGIYGLNTPGTFAIDDILLAEPTADAVETPEPASLALWGLLGVAGVAARWRHKRRAAAASPYLQAASL